MKVIASSAQQRVVASSGCRPPWKQLGKSPPRLFSTRANPTSAGLLCKLSRTPQYACTEVHTIRTYESYQ